MTFLRAEMTFGVTPGYASTYDPATGEFGARRTTRQPSLERAALEVAAAWDEAAEELQAERKEAPGYVSVVIVPCLVRYRKTWGCPDGGEVGCLVTCTSNPTFDKDLDGWAWRVIEIARRTKKALQQTTLTISFSNGTHAYLKGPGSVVHADGKRFEFDDSRPFDAELVYLA